MNRSAVSMAWASRSMLSSEPGPVRMIAMLTSPARGSVMVSF